MNNAQCTVKTYHCESCGSVDPEDVGRQALVENDGYTACCNERVAHPDDCRGHHGF
jgi:hypothetical protein